VTGPRALLARRPGCLVALEPAAVTKTFLDADPAVADRLARTEFERLRRFAAVLRRVDGVTCPDVLELVADPAPQVRMERVPGRPLISLLRAKRLNRSCIAALAESAAHGLAAYIGGVGEPYHDFQFDNMLYDEQTATLGFVDVGDPSDMAAWPTGCSAEAISLGNLIASTMFQSVRPRWLLARRQHAQAALLCGAVVERSLVLSPTRPSRSELASCASTVFVRLAYGGRIHRRLWYHLAAPLLAGRIHVAGMTFSPPRPPARRPAASWLRGNRGGR
jgi:hypothetical protein